MSEDYEVIIEDMPITKHELIRIINEKISRQWAQKDETGGFEIEVEDSWKQILREDGSILWDYQKLGWKAMHYRQTDNEGNVRREWLNFKNPNYKEG